jgi:hypothetical protein
MRVSKEPPIIRYQPAMSSLNMLAFKVAATALCALAPLWLAAPVTAQENWKPFAEKDAAAARRQNSRPQPAIDERPPLPSMSDASASPWRGPPGLGTAPASASPFDPRANAVESGDLAPIIASDGSGLPIELWNGLDIAGVEAQLARMEIPPRSPAVNSLWRRLLQSESTPGGSAAKFQAIRAEAFARSGLLREQSDALAKATTANAGGTVDAVLLALKARSDVALGQTDTGCAAAKEAGGRKSDLPKRLKGEVIVIAGYCAAAGGNPSAAGLAADLAREEGHDAPVAIAALDAIALGPEVAKTQKIAVAKKIDAIEYRLLQMTAPQDLGTLLERAEPTVLALLIADDATDPKLRLAAAESAARSNVIAPDRLADIYRTLQFAAADLADPLTARPDPLTRRALLLKAAEAERTPQKKTRLIRALLDDARRVGLYMPMLRIAAKPIASLQRQIEIGWFAETAVEAMIAAERYDDARAWAGFGQGLDRPAMGASAAGLQHWMALIDIADPATKTTRGASLASVEQMALAGRFTPEMLHRLATVLDALDYQVPIPLWEAASKTPQPNTGHLPETGVLTELQDAAKKKEFGRTVLLTLRTLGSNGAEGAHMIALGDAVRALKRADLEPDARRLGFEALFAGWPRMASN